VRRRTRFTCKKTGFLRHLYIKVIFYQDRLGTNIGKTQKKPDLSKDIVGCLGWALCVAEGRAVSAIQRCNLVVTESFSD
jgi:hypothetical protein